MAGAMICIQNCITLKCFPSSVERSDWSYTIRWRVPHSLELYITAHEAVHGMTCGMTVYLWGSHIFLCGLIFKISSWMIGAPRLYGFPVGFSSTVRGCLNEFLVPFLIRGHFTHSGLSPQDKECLCMNHS